MFAKVINAVLILQVLAHSIFGCCWHHDHATGSTACSHRAVATAPAETGKCRHHDHSDHRHASEALPNAQAPAEPQPHRQPPCDEESCLFVHSVITDASDALLLSLALDDCCVLPTPIQTIATVPTFARWPGRTSVCLTSVERCALLQAWLI